MAARSKRSARAPIAARSCRYGCRRPNLRRRISRWATMSNATILVIDDELPIRQFLRAAFEFEGFTVHEAKDAEEGIRSATLEPPDLWVLDHRAAAVVVERPDHRAHRARARAREGSPVGARRGRLRGQAVRDRRAD